MTDLQQPTRDWATTFDHTDEDYAQHAPEIWDDLRQRCPVAHGEAHGGVWFPSRHDDVSAIANDTERFTSEGVIVSIFKPENLAPMGYAPPITADPPFHAGSRRILLPAFSPKAIEKLEPATRETCNELIDDILASSDDIVDAAVRYTQHIPVRVIARMLGVPPEDGDRFRMFIHRILEKPGTYNGHVEPENTLVYYIDQTLRERATRPPQDDLIGYLMSYRDEDGNPLPDEQIFGNIGLLIIAGIDTTWSAIGASLWHLAQHRDDRRRIIEDPAVVPFAVEELLRFYAPVTMARIAKEDMVIDGAEIKARDWLLLPFPAANRDPEAFEDAGSFVIDRQRNRHLAFGLGIHRCAGSNLARMELRVAIEEWLRRIPEYELADPEGVRWSTGQVRGPRELPVRILQEA
ncbi:MAG: cytochrome P450 [Acidimicrobiales bacterium]|nr:cytochrome P450 [Acidimicrobiales bacterium]HRW37294.1 cytochrome P450 [Aquihabitans sp.]